MINGTHHFRKKNLRLNEHFPLEKETCQVKGFYELTLKLPLEEIILKGNWMVEYELDDDLGYWYVINVQVDGINF